MDKIKLTARTLSNKMSIDYAMEKRASCRNFEIKPLTLQQLSNILWSGQGVIGGSYNVRRTAPSAGASYPLRIYAAIREKGVEGLEEGIYQYIPEEHALKKFNDRDVTQNLADSCFSQDFLQNAGVNILIAADYGRTVQRYASRGERYVYMEVGSATQNIYLEAVALGLGTVVIGAFDDAALKELFGLEKLAPLAVMPVGWPKDKSFYA